MAFDLVQRSREFRDELTTLLNVTVCNGPQLTVLAFPDYTVVGFKISRYNVRGEGLPITISQKAPKFYLSLSIRLQPDVQEEYLAVRSSAMILATEPLVTNENMLLHYDYERDKQEGYTEAHLHICATSAAWEEAGRRHDGDVRLLDRLHLPVGGRRFRPTLEDILEFLIAERLVEARPNWKDSLEASREGFRERQLRAAIRRFPEVALDQLRADKHLPADT